MSKIKYFRNFVLCGDLNYRCLLCKVNFLDVTDVDKHLRWEKHKKALNKTTCMPRFRKDSIFKLQSYYYCSFCNRTMQDIEETKQHIESDIHKNQKSHPKAATTRVEVKLIDDVICINNTQISHLQWNGIIDKHCLLCNVVVNNLCSHPYSEHHMTDKHTFQCFTCKKTFSIYKFDDHFMNHSNNNSVEATNTANGNVGLKKEVPIMTDKNENPLKDCTISETNGEYGNVGIKKEVPIVTDKTENPLKDCTISETNGEHGNVGIKREVPIVTDKNENPLKDCTMSKTNGEHPTVLCGTGMEKIRQTEWDIQMLAGLYDDFFNIEMEAKKVSCKECKKDIKICQSEISTHLYAHGIYNSSFSRVYKVISQYIEKNYIQRDFDYGAAKSKAAQYGKVNYIKMNAGGSKGYCTLCDKFIVASIEVFKVHVAGGFHKGHLELKGIEKPQKHERVSYKSVAMVELIKSLLYSADKKNFLINGDFLINEDSFFLMKRIEHGKYYKKTKCFACDETLLPEDEKEHCISWKHKSNLLVAKTDKHTFQCFTCKKTFSIYKFDDHFMNQNNNNSVEATNTANGNVGLKKEVPIVTDKNENPLKDCTISKTNGEHGNAGIKKEVPILTDKNENPLKDCTVSKTNGEHGNAGIKKEVPIVTVKNGNPLKDCTISETNGEHENVGIKKEVPIVTDKDGNPLKDCTISETNGEHGNVGIKKEVPIVTDKNENPLKDCTISETNGEHGNVGIKKEVPIVTDKDGNPLKDCTMSETNGEHPTVLCGTGMAKIQQTEWDIQMLAGLDDDFFNIEMEAKKVSCKECKKDIKICQSEISTHLFTHGIYNSSFSRVYKVISQYIEKNYIQRDFDYGAAKSKAAQYGKVNYIKMNAGGSKGYCTLCDKFIVASIEVFKVHVAGGFHKGHLELKGIEKPQKHERVSYKSVAMVELIKSL
ncbi:Zinc finger protein 41, partial [Operophtera brumata]